MYTQFKIGQTLCDLDCCYILVNVIASGLILGSKYSWKIYCFPNLFNIRHACSYILLRKTQRQESQSQTKSQYRKEIRDRIIGRDCYPSNRSWPCAFKQKQKNEQVTVFQTWRCGLVFAPKFMKAWLVKTRAASI